MKHRDSIGGYKYETGGLNDSHSFLLPTLLLELAKIGKRLDAENQPRSVFDLGCGNGSVGEQLRMLGWNVVGVDPSSDGIQLAHSHFPDLNVSLGSAYEDLAKRFGQFPVAISLEVVEHVYAPREFARRLYELVESGGTAILSTPYHGYLKNLALAVCGRMDAHFTALWDHGHIKFWSKDTLSALLHEAGFRDLRFRLVGRIPPLAKSMVVIARK
jgi:2-polyprenyl-3-methyl-5-hydroxy-6-metoxy-1,4-benzoquinol methylase